MKTVSTAVNTLLQRTGSMSFVLVDIGTPTPLRFTTLPFDITMTFAEGARTFLAGGPLTGYEPPRMTSVVDREIYRLNFADTDGSFRARFDSGLIGTKISVTLGFINNGPPVAGSDAVSVGTGEPLRHYLDTITIYSGAVDSSGVVASFSEESNIATIECSSPMGALDMKNSFFTSKDSMRNRYPGDSSFDFVHQTSGASMLLWGKA